MLARQTSPSLLREITKRYNSTTPVPKSYNESVETLRESMRGQVPKHQSLLLLYTTTPAEKWPVNLKGMSPRFQAGILHQSMFQGRTLMCNPGTKKLLESGTKLGNPDSVDIQRFTATFFSKFMEPLNIENLAIQDIEKWSRLFQERVQDGVVLENMMHSPAQARSVVRSAFKSQEGRPGSHLVKRLWILVCVHGNRDCRCGEHGTSVLNELRQEIRRRNLLELVHVCGVSHVGGHAFAANVLVYPYGDWYGTMRPEHVPSFLDSILGVEEEGSLSGPQSPLWRGSWFDTRGELRELPSRQTREDVAKDLGIDLDAPVTRGD